MFTMNDQGQVESYGKIFENFAEYLKCRMESVYFQNGKCQFTHFDFYSTGGDKKLRKMCEVSQ